MEDDIESLIVGIERLNSTILMLNNTLEQGKGAWKLVLFVGTIVGFLTSIAAKWVLEWKH